MPDGMKVDAAGRVFCTGPGGVWVYAPDGEPSVAPLDFSAALR
jgi:sugar lactone lactonase YvrE